MDFLINSADSVAVPYLEFSEILILGVEAVLEVRKRFFFFTLLDLLDQSVHLHSDIALHIGQNLQQLDMALLVFSVIPDQLLIE